MNQADDPELQRRLNELAGLIAAMASMDFTRRMSISSDDTTFDAVAVGLNMLCEELGARQAEELALRAQLEHSGRLAAVGQLAAGVAHEVNNPAAAVVGNNTALEDHQRAFAALLAGLASVRARHPEAPLTREIDALLGAHDYDAINADFGDILAENAGAMGRIVSVVRDLRSYAQIDADVEERLDVNDTVRVASSIVSKHIRYRADLRLELGALPPTVGSRGRLTQVFTSLLLNAAQAIEEGARDTNVVRIRSRVEGDVIVVQIEDSGRGIPPDQRERVFMPFYTTKPTRQSSGLGLSLASEIVREHGGELTFESEPGVGTTFTLRLPVREGAGGASSRRFGETSEPPARTPRLLVVDDDEALLSSYRRLLGTRFELTLVSSGAAALDALERGPDDFDAVLCDVMMADIDGPTVYRRACLAHPQLRGRFIFSSGGAFTTSTKEFIDLRGGSILEKPIDVERLEAMARALMTRPTTG